MNILKINTQLLETLYRQADGGERLRMAYDLRNSCDDKSQRMLNALLPGTQVPIHRHSNTNETTICLHGCLEIVFYEETQNDSCVTAREGDAIYNLTECNRVKLCPMEGCYGIQVPAGAWHNVVVHENSTIFEAKDGPYAPLKCLR